MEDLPVFIEREVYVAGELQQQFKAICQGRTVAAIVKKTYRLIQHGEVDKKINGVLKKYKVKRDISLTRKGVRMYQTILFDKLTMEPKIGDIVRYGIMVINSVDATTRLMLLPYTLRLECMNGVTHKHVMAAKMRRHIGAELIILEDFERSFDIVIKNFDYISKMYSDWHNTEIDIIDHKRLLKVMLPLKYLQVVKDKRPENMWEMFNVLTRLNTHDGCRNDDTKYNFDRTIEKVMNALTL